MCEIRDLEEENEKLEEELSSIQEEIDEIEEKLQLQKYKTNTFITGFGGYVVSPSYNGANTINTNGSTTLGHKNP